MNKSQIIKQCNLPSDYIHTSKAVDIDTLVHSCCYDLSQSAFENQLPFKDKQARYFADVVYPVAMLKICEQLNRNDNWVVTRKLMKPLEKRLTIIREALLSFTSNSSDRGSLGNKQKSILSQRSESVLDAHSELFKTIYQRQMAHHALFNQTYFREAFMVEEVFHKSKGPGFKFKLAEDTQSYLDWKKEKISELQTQLSDEHFNQTMLKSFAIFRHKVQVDFDSPVYGTKFVGDYMPELMARMISHTESNWDDEVNQLMILQRKESSLLNKLEELAKEVNRFMKKWGAESYLANQFEKFSQEADESKKDTEMSL